jgi:anhydro-N-acetylmuramic acid kinase
MKGLGLMSGTSLDGLDIAFCDFKLENNTIVGFEILEAETIPYPPYWTNKIIHSPSLSGLELMHFNAELGKYYGKSAFDFIQKYQIKPDFIASHGHTIFHQPNAGFTFQAGCGANIYAQTGITTVCDFRSVDVAFGGQGAPLVPIGDALLFKEYDFCLNIGGFANISLEQDGIRIAWDICAANIVLNYLCNKIDKPYDAFGEIARNGESCSEISKQLDNLAFYIQKPPKSLGREWVEENIIPIFENSNQTIENKIATFTEHIAQQISYTLHQYFSIFKTQKLLVTGGGAFNTFLIERIQKHCKNNVEFVQASDKLIMFKEALIFAFLGALKLTNQTNSIATVTGASKNSIGGAVYGEI